MQPMSDSDGPPNRRAASGASERPRPLPPRVEEGERSEPDQKKWGKRAFAAGLVLFVGAWAWAFWYEAHRPKPEPLDAASQHAVAAVCRTALGTLRGLPQVGTVPTVDGRVARITAENTALQKIVAGFAAIHPTDAEGAKALTGFTKDWRDLLSARRRYVKALAATGERPKLVIPVAPDGAPVTIRMGEYARIHHLDDCTPDSLQGEVVEGRRTYPKAT